MLKLKGCYTAVVTPMKKNRVDFESFEKIIKFQAASRVSGIVPCGSTGEGGVLKDEDYLEVIRKTVEIAKEKKSVIAGFGTNSTEKTLSMLKKVEKTGVDGLLALVPYYNKPTQRGMVAHFSAIAQNTRLPVILYNIPGRTGVNMLPATVLELRKRHANIVGVKEASGNLDQVSEIINLLDEGFTVLSGDDGLTLPMMSVGARGVISVASNVAPDEISSMCEHFLNGDIVAAAKLHHKYFNFIKALFVETNPIPVKYAMHLKGYCSPELKLPLTELTEKSAEKLRSEMKNCGLL